MSGVQKTLAGRHPTQWAVNVHPLRRTTSGKSRVIIDLVAHVETMRKCIKKPMRCPQRQIKVGVSRYGHTPW
jgi:hypothetical protein